MTRAVERDVGQVLWIGFDGTALSTEVEARIAREEIGAVVLFARNIAKREGLADVSAVAELARRVHEAAPDPGSAPLIAIDQEGGRVQRIREPATVWPPMLCFERLAERFNEREANRLAFSLGYALGAELAALGIDVDFAPVLDVHTNPANPVIGDRAFGTEPGAVAGRALAMARGLTRSGVLPCGKHFPGHGDTDTDSHLELPRVGHDWERLRAVELAPFRAAAVQKLPMLMTAHVVFAAVDPERPATLSAAVLQGVLRKELGYRGVIVSDDLDMKAIRSGFGPGEAAVAAIEAGCDALLLCADTQAQQAAFEALLERGKADGHFRERLHLAADAVRSLRDRRLSPDRRPAIEDVVGRASHRELARVLLGN